MVAPVCAQRSQLEIFSVSLGTYSKSTDNGNVPALSTLGLDNEDAVATRASALLDCVTSIHKCVDRRVRAQTPLGQRDVVRDGSRQVCERDAERGIRFPSSFKDLECAEPLKSSDDQQSLDVVLLEFGRDTTKVDVGKSPVCAELGAAACGPIVNTEPGRLEDVVLKETAEAVVHSKRSVSMPDAVTDGSARCGVHSSCGSTDAVDNNFSGCFFLLGCQTYCRIAMRSR